MLVLLPVTVVACLLATCIYPVDGFQPFSTTLIVQSLTAFDYINCSPNSATTTITGVASVANSHTYGCPGASGGVHLQDSTAFQAATDATSAFNSINGLSCTTTDSSLTVNPSGTLTPGVYCYPFAHVTISGTLTLDFQANPNAFFAFTQFEFLVVSAGASIVAINDGGNGACRTYWTLNSPGGQICMGAGSTFIGSALTSSFGGNAISPCSNTASINVRGGSSVTGRLISLGEGILLESTSVMIDHCDSTTCFPNPCLNSGVCSGNNVCTCPGTCHCSGATCQVCDAGYILIGSTCVVNHCLPTNPCAHGGVCTPTSTSFTCTCPIEYDPATHCTTCAPDFIMHGSICVPAPCAPNPCQHGGACVEVGGNFSHCNCPPHFIGEFCTACAPSYNLTNHGNNCTFIDLCHPDPCQHGGICIQNITTVTFTCECVGNFVGARCSVCRPGWNLVANTSCVFGGFGCSPPVAHTVVVDIPQGPTLARPFALDITHFPFVSGGCNDINNTIGAIIETFPTEGHLLLAIDGDPLLGFNIIGVVPFYLANLSDPRSQLYFWPASSLDFGTPPSFFYSEFNYVGVVGPPNTPSFRVSGIAQVIINLNATNLPPVALAATYTITIDSSITVILQGSNPNDTPDRIGIPWLAHGIPLATIVDLPVNGGILKVTPSSPPLTLLDLPAQIGPPPPLPITYVSETIPLSAVNGTNLAIQDFFQFTVSNGVEFSLAPASITIDVVNPLQFLPSTNTTQKIRTKIRTKVQLQAINLVYPDALIGFILVALPLHGTLYIFNNGVYTPATPTNTSLPPANQTIFIGQVYGADQLYYQPFPTIVGFNADFIALRLINITDGFTSGVGYHFFWIVDPPVWVAPPNQPLQTIICGSPLTCTTPLFFTMKLLNGDTGNDIGNPPLEPALLITMRSNYGLGALLVNHPELNSLVTFIIGGMNVPSPTISFVSSRNVANLLMTNITFTSPLNLLQQVVFTARDDDNGTIYTVTNTVEILVNLAPTTTSSSSIWTPLTIGLTVLIIALPLCCFALVIYFLFCLCGVSSALGKEDQAEAKKKKKGKESKKSKAAEAKEAKGAESKGKMSQKELKAKQKQQKQEFQKLLKERDKQRQAAQAKPKADLGRDETLRL